MSGENLARHDEHLVTGADETHEDVSCVPNGHGRRTRYALIYFRFAHLKLPF